MSTGSVARKKPDIRTPSPHPKASARNSGDDIAGRLSTSTATAMTTSGIRMVSIWVCAVQMKAFVTSFTMKSIVAASLSSKLTPPARSSAQAMTTAIPRKTTFRTIAPSLAALVLLAPPRTRERTHE